MISIRFVGLDPSSKFGILILNNYGEVVEAEEMTAKSKNDPERMMELAKRARKHLVVSTDKVLIEGFAYGAKGQAVSFQYGLGWIVREMLVENVIPYIDVAPTMVKKFASNKGNAKKEDLVLPIYKKWGFEHPSDNVRDAYILARMGWSMYNHEGLNEYEKEVLKKLKKI